MNIPSDGCPSLPLACAFLLACLGLLLVSCIVVKLRKQFIGCMVCSSLLIYSGNLCVCMGVATIQFVKDMMHVTNDVFKPPRLLYSHKFRL